VRCCHSVDCELYKFNINVDIYDTCVCFYVCLELAVDVFQEVAPRELGRIDMYWASEVSR